VPTEHQVKAHPRLAYQLFFDEQTPAAIDELNRDVRRTLRGTLRDVATPPPDSFLTSRDTYVGAWDGVDEVGFFCALLGLGPCVKPILRSPQSHSSRKRRRITGLSNTAKAALITVSFHASRECGKLILFFAALQFYTAEVRVIAFGLIPFSHSVPKNNLASWKFANEQGNHTIPQPILSILATEVCPRAHQRSEFS
jgi:soluble epoxide hydrolase/lipid-phosphate phosphatase